MAASFRLLLLAALLLPAAAAATYGHGGCEPALLATRVARFCATDITSDHCCDPLLAAVHLHGGACLCRVAAAAGLNATGLLTSCGGLLRADLAACHSQGTGTGTGTEPAPPSPGPRTQQPSPPLADEATTDKEKQPPHLQRDAHSKAKAKAPLAVISPAPAPHSGASSSHLLYGSAVVRDHGAPHTNKCAAMQLADRLVVTCDTSDNAPSLVCCETVSTIVEHNCLCEVSEEPEVGESTHMHREQILFLYNICGGDKQVPPGQCGPVNPPPPPATLLQPPPSSSHHGRRVSLSTLLPSLLGGFLGLLAIAYGVYRLVQWAKLQGYLGGVASPPGPDGLQLQEQQQLQQQLQQQRDAAASAAEERLQQQRDARAAV